MAPDERDAAPEAATRIREEIARRRLSRQSVANMARISVSTLEKALAGKRAFTLATLVRLEEALGVSLRAAPVEAPEGAAPLTLGAYNRAAVQWMEGRYLTLRPGFTDPTTVYAYLTTILWDAASTRLRFQESARQDNQHAQRGEVSMPYLSTHIYLVTNEMGQFRTVMLGRPTLAGDMFGILTTLFAGDGTQLIPIACPIALKRLDADAAPTLGSIAKDDVNYATYRGMLDANVKRGFARFHL